MPLEVGDAIQIQIFCSLGAQTSVTSWYYTVDTIPGLSDSAVARLLADAFVVPWTALMCNDAQYDGVKVTNLTQTTIAPSLAPPKQDTFGNAGAIPLPRQCAALVGLLTERGGKHGRGRRYLPFPAAADNESDGIATPTDGYRNRCNNLLATIAQRWVINAGGGAALTLVPVVRANLTVQPVPPVDPPLPPTWNYFPITRYLIPDAWATQKRRGYYGRANFSPFA